MAEVVLLCRVYWILQIATRRNVADGGWRGIVALRPLRSVVVSLVAYTAFAFATGSNLWPLMLILVSPVALVYLAIVSAIRAMA